MTTAGTYVQISRNELEEWLDSLPLKGRWHLKPGRAGVYFLPLSDTVAVQLNSTIGSADDAMGRGQASMHLSLVSLVTGQILNKKAQGQSHFNRTLNWRKTWRVGFDRLKDTYLKSQGFYDTIARIENREDYKQGILERIEKTPGWEGDSFISDLHSRVLKGGILTAKQEEALDRALAQLKRQDPAKDMDPGVDQELLRRMRLLYQKADQDNDRWLMEFLTSVGQRVKRGDPLSDRQQEVLDKNFSRHRVASLYRRVIRKLL